MEKGLFEVDDSVYTLKLNTAKVRQLEHMLDTSFVSEIASHNAMLSFNMLHAIFAVALYDVNDEKAVKGKKAQEILDALLEQVGYMEVTQVVLGKIEDDLGFLFQ